MIFDGRAASARPPSAVLRTPAQTSIRQESDPQLVCSDLELITVTDADAFGDLGAAAWDDLVGALAYPTPYLLHGWLEASFRQQVSGAVPLVEVAIRSGKLVGALPLEIYRWHGLRVCRFSGGALGGFRDVLLAPDEPIETARALLERARQARPDFFYLRCIKADSHLASLADLPRIERFQSAWLDLSDGWPSAFRNKIGRRHRQSFKQKRELLCALGQLRTHVARDAAELDQALEHTFGLHDLRWRGRYDGSGYSTDASRQATRRAVQNLAARAAYRIVTLELNGNPIAFVSYFVVGRTAVGHRTALDPTYARYSPGTLVFFDAFAACEAEGITRFEFGGGDDRYKTSLADAMEPLFDAVGLASGIRGAIGAVMLRGVLRLGQKMRRSARARGVYRSVRDVLSRI